MSDEMDLSALADSFADMLGAEWPCEKAIAWARSRGGTFDESLWNTMAGLGWTALTVPEAHGGLSLGLDAAARLHMALGAAVAPVPMLGTTLATELVVCAGNETQARAWLPGLADGSLRIAFASPAAAAIDAEDAHMSGTCPDLFDAGSANTLFLRAVRRGQAGWLVLPADAAGVSIASDILVDSTRTLGTVTCDKVAIEGTQFLASSADIDDAITRAACIALAADAQGGGEAVLATTVEYMKIREQFGVLIGSFQALKHRVADHQAALVAARGLVEHAAGLAANDSQALVYALSAKQHVTRLTAEIARDCIQLHGGVGFTAEFSPHLYLKRGKVNEAVWGIRATLLDRIADLLEAA